MYVRTYIHTYVHTYTHTRTELSQLHTWNFSHILNEISLAFPTALLPISDSEPHCSAELLTEAWITRLFCDRRYLRQTLYEVHWERHRETERERELKQLTRLLEICVQ